MVHHYAIIYKNTRTGMTGCSTDVFSSIDTQISLINWYQSRHKFVEVVAIVEKED